MFTKFAFKKPKQRRISELLAKGFGQLSSTCDEPDQLTIPEHCLRRFTPVRPRIFSAFGHCPNFTHAGSFIVDTCTGMIVYVNLEHLAQEMAISIYGLTRFVDNGQENSRVRLAALTTSIGIEPKWSAADRDHSKPLMERINRSISERLKNAGLGKTRFKPGRTTSWPTTHQAQCLELSNHN